MQISQVCFPFITRNGLIYGHKVCRPFITRNGFFFGHLVTLLNAGTNILFITTYFLVFVVQPIGETYVPLMMIKAGKYVNT